MTSSFSPEITVLLKACTLDVSPEKTASLAEYIKAHPLNWELLLKLSTRHRLNPFLYRTLQHIPGTSESVLTTLQQTYRIAATDNLLKLHHYQAFKTLLNEHSIDHLPLKGVYFAGQCYPDSSLRITGDIDILIQKEDVVKTVDLLQKNGYTLNKAHEKHWQQDKEVILADIYEVSLFKPFFSSSHFDIDLHWNVLGFNKDYFLFDLNYVRSPPDHLAEKQLILLTAHHGVVNIWQHIYYINDLYFSLYKADIHWEWLLDELRRFGYERVFLVGLYWCRQIWNIALPTFIQSAVESPDIVLLAESYARNWKNEEGYEFSQLITRQLIQFTKAQTQASKRLKIGYTFLTSRLFRYSLFKVGDRLIYVPRKLGFLTIFIRAAQSLVRFFPNR